MDFDQLPIEWQRKIKDLRAESATYRIQRNELRAELDAVKAELNAAAPK